MAKMFTLKIIVGLGALVIFIALIGSVYKQVEYQQSQKLLKNPTLAAQLEVQDLLQKVGNVMELPKGESPTIATVSDVTKLKNQPFFVNAQNGDKVLIYAGAKEAILYRPGENKIIGVAPVNLGQNSLIPIGNSTSSAQKVTPTLIP